jgi:hypothetical protein
MPNWRKTIRDAYRDYGGVVVSRGSGRGSKGLVDYRFPDGAIFYLPNDVDPGWAKKQLGVLQQRYGRRVEAHSSMRRNGRPELDLEQVHVSDHARERLALMDAQAGVDRREFLRCLTLPQTVLWSDVHDSWLFVRERLAVAVKESRHGGHVVPTVMWATQDMFEAHPRPERRGTS